MKQEMFMIAEVFLKEGWGEKVEEVKLEIETQEITQEIETQELKLEKKPRKNANK
jgi:hypothetical protein